jgi:outer membrane lipoprotein LolB
MIRPLLLAIFALISLAACSTLQQVASPDHGQSRDRLLAVNAWELRGRIAVTSHTGQGDGQANLRWRQLDRNSQLRVSGPFGVGSYELSWSPERVTVSRADGEQSLEYTGADAAQLFLQAQLGWSFPADSARYWVLGLLDPRAPGEEVFDAEGRLAGLSQHGWQLSFDRFTEVSGFALPTRISMENPNARLKIVVSKWKLPLADS